MENTTPKPPLAPCPFCGGEAKIDRNLWADPASGAKSKTVAYSYQVRCCNCQAASQVFVSQEEAAMAAWNTRAKPQAPKLKWQSEDGMAADSVVMFGVGYWIDDRLNGSIAAGRYGEGVAVKYYNSLESAKQACQDDFDKWFNEQMEQ